ncbi:ubiquinone/menaquinone biosynthesis methyltransferase [candidate division KSB1 bacterium]|nr:ubiquinone/menaquinone biosynthesis methyltransferase [candidate division KSB1 bacterium]
MQPKFANLKESDVDIKQRQKYVTELFDNLAPNYDRFNRWVSFFRDETWRRKTIELLDDCKRGSVLDLAAGTGDLARSALKAGAQQVHVFDIAFNMLIQAKAKLRDENSQLSKINFELGSAARLPFKDNSFDGIVSGFAMRNVFHFLDEVLSEMHRILKPGARFAILELSQPQNSILRAGFRVHMKTIMPLIGKLTAGKSTPFQYLCETTLTFLSPEEFKQRLENAGFAGVSWKNFLFGGIAIHFGQKPIESKSEGKIVE